jgi:hypothetical protein
MFIRHASARQLAAMATRNYVMTVIPQAYKFLHIYMWKELHEKQGNWKQSHE